MHLCILGADNTRQNNLNHYDYVKKKRSVNMANSIQIEKKDNVVVLTEDVKAGETVTIQGLKETYIAREDIGVGHKMAIAPIKNGESVIKFGIPIGPTMSDVAVGDWISAHNIKNDAVKAGEESRKRVRESGRRIMAFTRADGRFGVLNVVMVIPASPDCNSVAEAISDATGCAWMCCNRLQLENGKVSEYTRMALGYTGCNPNIHSVLILRGTSERETAEYIYQLIEKTGKPIQVLDVTTEVDYAIREGVTIVKDLLVDAAEQKRESCSIDGLAITVHNNGSDWSSPLAANPTVGHAMDLLIRDGGRAFHAQYQTLSGSEDIMAAKCVSREVALKLLAKVEYTRASVLEETGAPIEMMNMHPSPYNIQTGVSTLLEKGYGMVQKYGKSPIQGLLGYCEQPPHNGLWMNTHDNVSPPTSAIYGSVQGAHMHIMTTSAGFLYYEIPHMIGIRVTSNDETFNNPEYKKDFNAFFALKDGVEKAGEKLYQLVLDVAEGKVIPKSEVDKQKVFHMWYHITAEFGGNMDRSGRIPSSSKDYAESVKKYTDLVK